MSERAPVLSLRGISKSFPGVKALQNVQLDLYPGQVTALIGENGAGKSTIVKLALRLLDPQEGRVLVGEGDALAAAAPVARHGPAAGVVGAVAQVRAGPAIIA